jgi:transcriptional regulator with XRE-family HTH domain
MIRVYPATTVAHITPAKMVRITREMAELSQVELARRARMMQATVSGIETGKVTLGLERAKRLAKALGVHPAVLLFPNM